MLKSTRSNTNATITTAILQGLADNGGLFVFNNIDSTFFQPDLLSLSYRKLTNKLFRYLIDDIEDDDLQYIIEQSYNDPNFQPDTVSYTSTSNFTYLNLYHGNSFAFKDMALSVLPNLFTLSKQIQNINKPTVILTATSGDTGSAALAGFSKQPNTYTIVLYPTKGVSEFQEMQMNAFQSDKLIIYAVDGNFDDCQNIVKQLFKEVQVDNVLLSSANSINIGRLIPQIVYYIYSYLKLVRENIIKYGEEINFSVPTGNFGNIYAGYLAKRLGVPIKKLLISSNQNNVLTDAFNKGIYKIDRTLHPSISPSMDILISSNLERYIYDCLNQDYDKVNELMESLAKDKQIDTSFLNKSNLFYAGYATEEDTYQTIRKVFQEDNHLIDPHTAIATFVANEYHEKTKDNTHMVIVSTANPYKFSDALLDALHLPKDGNLLERMERIETYTKFPIDPRMKKVYNEHLSKKQLSKEKAYVVLKKVIGDIDAKS